MNNFFKAIVVFSLIIFSVSCSEDDNNASIKPLEDYQEQYEKDIAIIEKYLQTHYIEEVINNPGQTNDQDISFAEIPAGGTQTSIMEQTDYPIKTRIVRKYYGIDKFVDYKIYYLQLRQGSGPTSKSPCNVDRILTSYRGEYLDTETVDGNEVVVSKFFEELTNPQSYFNLTDVIRGWSEIFPQFMTGSYNGNPDGTLSYTDFGAGVMFIPSGLAYYSQSSSTIPAYSPLFFSFKLYEIQRADQDEDGIPSYQEDLDNDGYVRTFDSFEKENNLINPDDTDGDEKPDFVDLDDDEDYYITKAEIKNPLTDEAYPFDEIPTCIDGKKRHLSAACH